MSRTLSQPAALITPAKAGRRIMMVVNNPAFFLSHRLPLALTARDAGFEVIIATPAGPDVAAIAAHGFRWVALPLTRSGMHPVDELQSIWALVRLYRSLRPHLVHHVTIKPVVYGTFAARVAGVPAVVNAVSGMGFLFTSDRLAKRLIGRQLYRLLMRHARMAVIVQNQQDYDFFRASGLASAEQLALIRGSGVDLQLFRPDIAAAPRPHLVVQTSRMLADKGVREFIAAAKMVRERAPEVRFALVGGIDPGNPSSLTEEELVEAHAAGHVEWWGHRQDMTDVLRQATIYCLPSYREGLPKSLIEAAACGIPLVTTDTSGCAEVVQHDVNGLLVPVGDANAIAAAVLTIVRDPALAARLGAAARSDAEARFSLERVVSAQLELYRRLLSSSERLSGYQSLEDAQLPAT